MHDRSFPKLSSFRRLSPWAPTGLIVVLSWLEPSLAFTQDIGIPGRHPLTDIEEIELVYAGTDPLPKIIVRGQQAANSFVLSSYRPSDDRLNVLTQAGEKRPVVCRTTSLSTVPPLAPHDHQEPATCGIAWPLHTADKALDALSFRTLRVRGSTSSPLRIELAEGIGDHHRAHPIAEQPTGRFTQEIPLAPLAQRVDLRRLMSLQLITEHPADLVIDELVFLGPTPETPPAPSLAFWYWDYQTAIRDPKEMVAACQKHHCRRILLQLPDLRDSDATWTAYARLFSLTRSVEIELFALDGAPDMIDHAPTLIKKLDRLLTVAESRNVAGVQLDIEPYLLDGFPDDQTIFQRYLDTIDRVKASLQNRTRLSMVIPFWFASTVHRDRPLAFAVMDRVDEVAVMSYRTDVDELTAIGDDILRYGSLAHVPVWLAIETTRLPPEQHVILKREYRAALTDALVDPIRRTLRLKPSPSGDSFEQDQIGFRIHHRTTVRPERVSFFGHKRSHAQQMITDVFARIRHASFSGLVIHDLPGYQALQ